MSGLTSGFKNYPSGRTKKDGLADGMGILAKAVSQPELNISKKVIVPVKRRSVLLVSLRVYALFIEFVEFVGGICSSVVECWTAC